MRNGEKREASERDEVPRGPAAREQLLQAARRCFARAGYHGTSIKAIAAEAGIRSPSILHYHFPSKEALFLETVRQAAADLTERATQVGLAVTEGPRGVSAVSAFFSLLDAEEDLSPLLLECIAMGARDQPTRQELADLLHGLEETVAGAIGRLLGSGAERLPLPPRALAATLLDLLVGHAIRATVLRPGAAPGDLADERRGILTLLGLVRPAPRPTPGE